MELLQQILFVAAAAIAIWMFSRKILEIRRNIFLARKDPAYNDRPAERWRNVFLLALGQKKMFRNPLVAILHFVIYAGFIIINIEVLEIFLDGVFGTHRMFAGIGPIGLPVEVGPRVQEAGRVRAGHDHRRGQASDERGRKHDAVLVIRGPVRVIKIGQGAMVADAVIVPTYPQPRSVRRIAMIRAIFRCCDRKAAPRVAKAKAGAASL